MPDTSRYAPADPANISPNTSHPKRPNAVMYSQNDFRIPLFYHFPIVSLHLCFGHFPTLSQVYNRLLYKGVPRGTDPLSPGNQLILATGAAVGSGIPATNKVAFVTKSARKFFAFSHAGGKFATAIRRSGYDFVVIHGRAEQPVYLFIAGEEVSIRDARHLRGKLIGETEELIKSEVGSNVVVGSIGPAGENLLPFASFVTALYHVSAKGGAGCIAGSKNLKAIAVRWRKAELSTGRVSELSSSIRRSILDSPKTGLWRKNGTLNLVMLHLNAGRLAGYNYKHNNCKEGAAYDPIIFSERLKERSEACYGCPVGCCQIYRVKQERGALSKIEWGSLDSLGPMTGVFDYDKVGHLQWLTTQYGLCAKETGALLGMIMEMYEDGIIKSDSIGGAKMTWGNYEAIKELIKAMVYRVGFGDILAQGIEGVVDLFGDNAKRYWMGAKGSGMGGLDVRTDYSWALGHAVSIRGPDCQNHFAYICRKHRKDLAKELFGDEKAADPLKPEAKGRLVWWSENYKAILDSLGICLFIAYELIEPTPAPIGLFSKIFNAVMDESISAKELFKMGERIVLIGRAFNLREGFSRGDDTLPQRMLEEPTPDEPAAGLTVPLYHPGMLDEYYSWRGCNREAVLTRERLEEVELQEIADELYSIGKLSESRQDVSFNKVMDQMKPGALGETINNSPERGLL